MTKKDKSQPAEKTFPADYVRRAIDRAERKFREHGRLERFMVQENPANGHCKLTFFSDCEDGMYQYRWRVP